MKSILLLICFLMAAPRAEQATVEVILTGVKPGKGTLRVGLFDQSNFLVNPVEGKEVDASSETVVVRFEHVAAGVYAVSVIHDTNGNGELDKSKLGVPREGFAFSNNVMGKKGPPSFDRARFEVSGTSVVKQEISMRYP